MTDDVKAKPENAGVESPLDESVGEPEEVVSESVALPASDLLATAPKKKWHDRKWLLVAIVSLVALLLGVGMAAPDRQAAADEAERILADAKKDARDEADGIVEDAKEERDNLLSDAEADKADLLEEIESAEDELANTKTSIQTAKAELRKLEKSRVQKQKQVDNLNRAIRSSTSLSRQNAVAKARDYLDFSSFSCQGLIDQLSSEYADQFSVSDATYAAKQVGLC